MNQEIKNKWIEALRSGKYQQTTGRLKRNDGYCCLGVLCDVIDSSKWKKDGNQWCYMDNVYDEHYELPIKIKKEAGLSSCDPYVKVKSTDTDDFYEKHLSNLNDSGFSFKQIADVIEEQL